MKLPKQAAPVERIASTSAVSHHSGLEASSVESSRVIDDVLKTVGALTPLATAALPFLL
ncbi:MAG: hypothetical protein F6K19_06685 [Cyanothece sp. SIO1E1]|nr:hypothetical protein [Cyanothece sp. SIO1E1]